MLITLRSVVFLSALSVLTACAAGGGGGGVPAPSAERLVHVTFAPLTPRQLNVSVTDDRSPLPANSDSVVDAMTRAVGMIMTGAGITVTPSATSSMHISLKFPSPHPPGFTPQDCIELSLDLRLVDGTRARAPGATTCFAQPNASGARSVADATEVYETALNEAMKEMDRVHGTLGRATPAVAARRQLAVSDTLGRELAAKGAIAWSPRLRLQVTDFKAAPPADPVVAAISDVGLITSFACSPPTFEFGVIAVFLPSESWVKSLVRLDTLVGNRVLIHERTHFDISEIGARQLRRTLMTVKYPCSLSKSELNEIATAGFNDSREIQKRYDKETGHGVKAEEQQRWTAWARAKLDTLGEWAGAVGEREN